MKYIVRTCDQKSASATTAGGRNARRERRREEARPHHRDEVARVRRSRTALAVVLATSGLLLHSAVTRAEAKVEIFSDQQPILLKLDQTKTVTLLGAVYDDSLANGVINIVPNGSQNTACPIFVSGLNSPINAPINTTNLLLNVVVKGPSDPQLVQQTFTCALTYSAFRLLLDTVSGRFFLDPIPTKGNEVRFQYTFKR